MNVLMVIAQYHPIIGGAEQQAHRLAQKLSAQGCKVDVVTGRWYRTSPPRELLDGISIFRNTTGWDWLWKFKIGHLIKHYTWEFSLLLFLLQHHRKYDVFHVHQALHAAFVTCFANVFLNKKVIVKVACGGDLSDVKMMQQNRASPFGRLFWQFIKRCTKIIAINREIEQELLEDGFPREKIVKIPNGFAIAGVTPRREYQLANPNLIKIVSVGRLDPQKGFDILISSCALGDEQPLICSIFGTGKEEKVLQKQIRDKGLTAKVILEGVIQNLPEKLPEFDIFVLVSRSEGLSNALLEAMGCGLPCIASAIGGNIDLLDPKGGNHEIPSGSWKICENGILVPKDDPQALLGAISFLAKETALRARLGNSARKWLQNNCSLDEVATRYVGLYRNTD